MRLWFAPSSEVPIYRQLVTQVVLAILSGDVRPGEGLPSTRELARHSGVKALVGKPDSILPMVLPDGFNALQFIERLPSF